MAALAADFFDKVDILQTHAFIDGLTHIVHRQQSHRYAGQGFHFDACLAVAFDGTAAFDFTKVIVEDEFDATFCQIQDMTEWNEITRPLTPHDAGNAGYAEDVAFFMAPALTAS